MLKIFFTNKFRWKNHARAEINAKKFVGVYFVFC
jgi:hypothetical protein